MRSKWGTKRQADGKGRQAAPHAAEARRGRRRQRDRLAVDVSIVARGQQDHQDRHGHAGDRPDRRFRRAVQWVAAGVQEGLADGITVAGAEIRRRDHHQGQPVQPEPGLGSHGATHQQRQSRYHDRDRRHPTRSIRSPTNASSPAYRASPSDDPWQAWFFPRKGDPKKGFEWTYHFFWGFDMLGNVFADMWLSMPTNKIVGDDVDQRSGRHRRQRQGARTADVVPVKGLSTSTNLGLYPPLSDDFSSQIAEMKKANAEIVCGIFNPPQFATFWTQCAQQGFKPKIVTPAEGRAVPDRRRGAG